MSSCPHRSRTASSQSGPGLPGSIIIPDMNRRPRKQHAFCQSLIAPRLVIPILFCRHMSKPFIRSSEWARRVRHNSSVRFHRQHHASGRRIMAEPPSGSSYPHVLSAITYSVVKVRKSLSAQKAYNAQPAATRRSRIVCFTRLTNVQKYLSAHRFLYSSTFP